MKSPPALAPFHCNWERKRIRQPFRSVTDAHTVAAVAQRTLTDNKRITEQANSERMREREMAMEFNKITRRRHFCFNIYLISSCRAVDDDDDVEVTFSWLFSAYSSTAWLYVCVHTMVGTTRAMNARSPVGYLGTHHARCGVCCWTLAQVQSASDNGWMDERTLANV